MAQIGPIWPPPKLTHVPPPSVPPIPGPLPCGEFLPPTDFSTPASALRAEHECNNVAPAPPPPFSGCAVSVIRGSSGRAEGLEGKRKA